jgi:hypothetical protein
MMFGKPLVSCATGGIPEVVQDGTNALLTRPGDATALAGALRRLIEDRELRLAFGKASRQRFEERFAIDAVAPRMASFFAAAAREHSASRVLADTEVARAGIASQAPGHDPADTTIAPWPDESEREHAAPDPRWTSEELAVHRGVCSEWVAEAALELEERSEQRQAWAERAAEVDRVAQATGEQLHELGHALEVITASRSWRLTRPLREASDWARRLRPPARRDRT